MGLSLFNKIIVKDKYSHPPLNEKLKNNNNKQSMLTQSKMTGNKMVR